jgi:hypothetical protein
MDHVQTISFLYLCIHTYRSSVLYYSDGMNYLVADGANSLRKRRIWWSPRVIKQSSGSFRPPVTPPSPPMPPMSLEQLLVSQNANHAEIDWKCWAPVKTITATSTSSRVLLSWLLAIQPPEFTETTNLLEANHWLHVTESKFGLLHYSEFEKTMFAAQ